MSNEVIDYSDAEVRVRADLGEAHTRYWHRLARAGSWWSGAERIAIAKETRQATQCGLCTRSRESLSPYAVEGNHDRVSDLPEAAVDVIHRIVTDASRLTQVWYERALDAGLSDGQYIEIVGTVVSVVSVDSFCRGLGLPPHALPRPVDGEPDAYRPSSASLEDAWVPLVPDDNSGTPEADLWPANRTGYVVRAMSLVPEEVRTLKDLSAAHYLPMRDVRNPAASRGALNRPQIELIAGRVSALNECFY